jgi:soluble lytic murein transglycosylase
MRRSATTDRAAPGRGAPALTGPPRPAAPGRRPRLRAVWLLAVLVLLAAAAGASWYQVHQEMPGWYARLWYPLEHEQAVREEATRNRLDPAFVAAVIDTESGFVADSRSGEGAVGLMQVRPETARFIAGLPRRPSPSPDRLAEPAVNIAYGTRFLRYLVDRYDSVDLALVAYNSGPTNLGRWLEEARAQGRALRVPADIPFAETRGFVIKVREAAPIYRRAYGDRLGPVAP